MKTEIILKNNDLYLTTVNVQIYRNMNKSEMNFLCVYFIQYI